MCIVHVDKYFSILLFSLCAQGRIQFFIESVETKLPNIIDSFLINLDTLQLGADFTEEMTYTGYHNISQMRMSFKVECALNYCGPDCTVSSLTNPSISNCESNGEVICINDKLDPSLLCGGCIDNKLDFSTDCLTCMDTAYDPAINCSTCLNPEYDIGTGCSTCVNPNFNVSTDCTTCLKDGYSPTTNCSLCLTNRDLSTNCTSCLSGWDLNSDCMNCSLPRRDPDNNCITCLPGYTGEDCMAGT